MDIQQIKERANELAAQGGRYGLTSEEQQELNELVRIEERFIAWMPRMRKIRGWSNLTT
jgi:hypothetical protein